MELLQEGDLSAAANGPTDVESRVVEDKARAYHSAYFEMLGEQGWLGLALWLLLHGTGLWQMERLYKRYRKATSPDQNWVAGLALALQQAHLVYLAGAVFIGIAFMPFAFLLIAVETSLARLVRKQSRPDGRDLFAHAENSPADTRVATFGGNARLRG